MSETPQKYTINDHKSIEFTECFFLDDNPDKFPLHYMFELNASELLDLKSKILISKVSPNNRKGTKVFTERGLYMLATVLKGERARNITS